MAECEHLAFHALVEVQRLQDAPDLPVLAYIADVHIHCADCDEPFIFNGVDVGLLPDRPMGSFDGKEIHLPIRPASAPDDFGLSIPGFTMRILEGGDNAQGTARPVN